MFTGAEPCNAETCRGTAVPQRATIPIHFKPFPRGVGERGWVAGFGFVQAGRPPGMRGRGPHGDFGLPRGCGSAVWEALLGRLFETFHERI